MLSVTSLATLAALCLATVSAQVSYTPQNVHRSALAEFLITPHGMNLLSEFYVNGQLMENNPITTAGDYSEAPYAINLKYNTEHEVAVKITGVHFADQLALNAALRIDGAPQFNSPAGWMASLTEVAGWNLPKFDAATAGFTAAKGCPHTYNGELAESFETKNTIERLTHSTHACFQATAAGTKSIWFYRKFTTPAASTVFAVTTCRGKGTLYSILSGTQERCLCDSRYEGEDCQTTFTDTAMCTKATQSLTVDNSKVKILDARIITNDLVVTTKFVNVNSRKFRSLEVKHCGQAQMVDLQSTQSWTGCEDHLTISVPFSALPNLCGFEVDPNVTHGGKKHTRYRGWMRVNYTETVSYAETTVRRAVSDTGRNVTVILPLDVLMQTQYTLPEIKDVETFSQFDLKAAVTGQYINPYGGSSIVTVMYALHFPYTVTSLNPVVAMSGTKGLVSGNVNVATAVTPGQHLRDFDEYSNTAWTTKERTRLVIPAGGVVVSVNSVTTAAACQAAAVAAASNAYVLNLTTSVCTHWKYADNVGLSTPITEVADQTGFTMGVISQVGAYVLREVNLTYTHNACELDGTYTIQGVTINCAAGLPAVDCPLYAPSTGNSIAFTLDSENFCAGQGFTAVISDALEITEFIAVPKNNIVGATEQQNAWLWNEPAYFRAQFAGLKIDRVDMMSLTTSADSHTANFATSAGLNANTAVSGVGAMGLDVASQRYYFTHPMTLAFAGAKPAEGVGAPLVVRCTVNVGYFAATSRRRRAVALRQEAEEEAGVAVVEAQGSVIAPAQQLSGAAPQQTEGAAVDDSGAGMVAAGVAALVAVMAF